MSQYAANFEFGPYQFDLTRRVLMCGGENISLTPKATEIVVLLVSNAGQLVEKDELLREVWPDTLVEESNLTQNVFTLRALGNDRTDPRYIETVARRGYRFIAPVEIIEPDRSKKLAISGEASFDGRPKGLRGAETLTN